MAENGNVNLVLGKALSVLPQAELFEPVRNPLHRNSADFPLASPPAGGSVHILLAKDCSRSRVGAHVVQWHHRALPHVARCPLWTKSGTLASTSARGISALFWRDSYAMWQARTDLPGQPACDS